MFDSPFDRCPVCNEMVLLDQTRKECAREHGCGNIDCPLARYFVGYDFSAAARSAPNVAAPRKRRSHEGRGAG